MAWQFYTKVMIKDKLNILKETLLEISVFDYGHAGVQKVSGTEIIIDEAGLEYVGINDKGNGSFYVRAVKDTSFSLLQRGGAVKRYKAVTPCELICTVQKLNVEAFSKQVIPIVSRAGVIKRISTDSAEIYIRETGNKKPKIDFKKWQLVKIEFDAQYSTSTIAECLVELCKC